MSSFFSFGNPGSSAIKPAAPVIRKEIRTVTKPKPPLPRPLSSDRPTTQTSRSASSTQPAKKTSQRKANNSRVTAVRAGTKRKSSSPSVQLFDSSSSDSDDSRGDGKSTVHKRTKVATVAKPTFTRCIRDVKNWEKGTSKPPSFVHGADLTAGEHAKNFKPAFGGGQETLEVELQYPSPGQTERYRVAHP